MTEPHYIPHRPLDKRYKDNVDTGAMSSNRIPLPLKPRVSKKTDNTKDRDAGVSQHIGPASGSYAETRSGQLGS